MAGTTPGHDFVQRVQTLGDDVIRPGIRGACHAVLVLHREPDQHRHHQQHQRELQHQPGDDGDRQRLLHRRSLADRQRQRQQRQDRRQRGHRDRPQPVAGWRCAGASRSGISRASSVYSET